jgi:hypothetical protein
MVPIARMTVSVTSAGRHPWASTNQAESGRNMVLAKPASAAACIPEMMS